MNLSKTIEEEYTNIQVNTVQELQKGSSDKVVNNLLEKCVEWLNSERVHNLLSSGIYTNTIDLLRKEEYNPEDILAFSMRLDDFSKNLHFSKLGLFCSALINTHYEKKNKKEYSKEVKMRQIYALFTTEHRRKMDNLCFKNSGAHVVITGDVGDNLAIKMTAGDVKLNGKGESMTGAEMGGGKLYLESCTEKLGESMTGGSIIVKQGGRDIGYKQNGGRIDILESWESIRLENHESMFADNKGEIYFQGKRIK